MQNAKLPKSKSMEPVSVLLLPSPALLIAEAEAALKATAPRLSAQQVRVAKGKKGRLRAALRHLWGKIWPPKANSKWFEVFCPFCRSHFSIEVYHAAQPGRPERQGESGNALPPVPPEEKKG